MDYDFIVAGGGLVGSSIAYGLLRQNYKVAALSMLEARGFIERREGLIRAQPEALDILNYYANSIKQWKVASPSQAES